MPAKCEHTHQELEAAKLVYHQALNAQKDLMDAAPVLPINKTPVMPIAVHHKYGSGGYAHLINMQNEVKTVGAGEKVPLGPPGSPKDVAIPDVEKDIQNADSE
jgi:hypothetical protein